MTLPKIALPLILFSLSLEIVTLLASPKQLQASPVSNATRNTVTFEPPQAGKPKDTVGGASRGDDQCPQDAKAAKPYVTLLIPNNNYGLTTAEHPTFFVYVPQTSVRKAFFSLHDENNNSLYQSTLPITGASGVVSFKLPADAPVLKVGNNYKWYFVLMCEGALRPDSPRVEGWIQRVNPDLALMSQLKKAAPLKRAALYGSAGIWYDTLAVLVKLRRLQPNDLTLAATWEELLNAVGLEVIATKPLIGYAPLQSRTRKYGLLLSPPHNMRGRTLQVYPKFY